MAFLKCPQTPPPPPSPSYHYDGFVVAQAVGHIMYGEQKVHELPQSHLVITFFEI